jgi:hypothetical protein
MEESAVPLAMLFLKLDIGSAMPKAGNSPIFQEGPSISVRARAPRQGQHAALEKPPQVLGLRILNHISSFITLR